MQHFDPPGFLDDFDEAQKDQWSQIISQWFDRAHQGDPNQNDGPRAQFFNPLTNPIAPGDSDAPPAVISWNAFPNRIQKGPGSQTQKRKRADSARDFQDEYCEWSVTRDPITNKIVRVAFTCEGPEYWDVLAALNPGKVLELYQKFISPTVTHSDLFTPQGKYIKRNRFNQDTKNGAMHLIQAANTLGAEIELAAAATIRRQKNGEEVIEAQELILCSQYGEPDRNSDPHIGEQVNALARMKADITLNNPVGLYMESFQPIGFVTPDGTDARSFWKWERGVENYRVRASFEVPTNLGYVVGDIIIDGKKIDTGSQIAEFITIKLEGRTTRNGQSTAPIFEGCKDLDDAPPDVLLEADTDESNPLVPQIRRRINGGLPVVLETAPPLVVPEALRERMPALLRQDFEDGAEDIEAAPPDLLPYPKLPESYFKPQLVSGNIQAFASPDSTYALTRKLLDSAQRSIVIAIYDFTADYVKEDLKNAMRRGVRVSLMLDTDNRRGENTIFDELKGLGAICLSAPSRSARNPNAYFGNAHQKIIVIDSEIVMVQSGNWSEASIPFNQGDGVIIGQFQKGNRDMGLAIHSRELATFFADLIARDMRLAQGQPAEGAPPNLLTAIEGDAVSGVAAELFFEAAPPAPPTTLFPSLTVIPSTPIRITPAVTPENFFNTLKLLLVSARRSLRIEQQYVRGGQNAVEALLAAIKQARQNHAALDIRLIVSPRYLDGVEKVNFLQAMEGAGLEFGDNFRYLARNFFAHCHNKLIVVDNETVLLGSQNWSTTGLLTNREASLLVEHAGIAGYFSQIFDADWEMSQPDESVPPSEIVGGLATDVAALVAPEEFAKGSVLQMTTRDFTKV